MLGYQYRARTKRNFLVALGGKFLSCVTKPKKTYAKKKLFAFNCIALNKAAAAQRITVHYNNIIIIKNYTLVDEPLSKDDAEQRKYQTVGRVYVQIQTFIKRGRET